MSELPAVSERRTQVELRSIFTSACEAMRPYFDPANSWGGAANHHHHDHLALRALKEEFPQLSAQQSYIVIASVKRLYAADANRALSAKPGEQADV